VAETPFDSREIVVLISAVFVFASSLRFGTELKRVPSWRALGAAMVCLIIGGTATIVEHFTSYAVFNLVEHVAYLCQSLFVVAWAFSMSRATG